MGAPGAGRISLPGGVSGELGIFEDEWNVHMLISWLATTPTTARVRRIWSWIFDGV